jgi:Flp pilus assembly protein TadD
MEAPESKPRMHWGRWIALNATVFAAAACIMAVEILSTRLAARYLGSSLYTWTSAIGVVLAGISLGNYVGGRFADRFHPQRSLSLLFVLASLTCAAIPAANSGLGQWTLLHDLSWPTRIFLHFTLAFLLPATVLGTMSPIVAKMALDMGLGAGRTVGTVYAWGSIGSIVGTFVSGFFLVAELGTESAILTVAAVLGVVGLVYGYRSWVPYAWTATFAAAMVSAFTPWSGSEAFADSLGLRDPLEQYVEFKQDSQYQRVLVLEREPGVRTMLLDKLIHSTVNLEDPLDLDPVVTEAAFAALGLPRDTTVRHFDLDARNRVSDLLRAKRAGEDVPVFDFVMGDAFNDFSVPFHLTTLEFAEQVRELMSDDGVYMLNLIDSLDTGGFLTAVVATCRRVFPFVHVFAASKNPQERSTFIVVCARRELDLGSLPEAVAERHRGAACLRVEPDADTGLVLTDDHAPVENLLAEVVSNYQGYVVKATELRPERDLVEMIFRAQQLYDNGRPAAAVPLLQAVMGVAPDYPGLRHDLAAALFESGREDEGVAVLREAVEAEPTNALLLERLGRMLAATEDLEGAATAFERAVDLAPEDTNARKNLALAYERLGRDADAVVHYRESLALLESLPVMNSLARLLAASSDEDARDPAEALRLAELLGERTGGDNPEALDTLALALAAAGRLDEAVEAAREASRLAGEGGLTELKRAIDERLADFVERRDGR